MKQQIWVNACLLLDKTYKQFSEVHICLDELQESNKKILDRLDNLIQIQEEDYRMRFQDGNDIKELENRINLIEFYDRRGEKELEDQQRSLKRLMEKSDHCYGIFSEGDPGATVHSLGKNVEINADGISDIGEFQQQSDMVIVGRSCTQNKISFVTLDHCSYRMHRILEVEGRDKHTTSSTNALSRQENERQVPEGSTSRDGSEIRVVKPNATGFSALDVPGPETAGYNVIKGHPSSLSDSEETSVDSHLRHILGPETEEHEIKETMSTSESSTIDDSIDNHTQGDRAVKLEGDIVRVFHGVGYNLESLQRKDVEQRDHAEERAQHSDNACTESEYDFASSGSNTIVHSNHALMTANSQRHSVITNSDSGGKNPRPQKSKNVVPKVKQPTASTDSYSNQPVQKLMAFSHATSSDQQMQQNSGHVEEHHYNMNFSKSKKPVKENI